VETSTPPYESTSSRAPAFWRLYAIMGLGSVVARLLGALTGFGGGLLVVPMSTRWGSP
jgi:uncharacterized membrane protein YfcA